MGSFVADHGLERDFEPSAKHGTPLPALDSVRGALLYTHQKRRMSPFPNSSSQFRSVGPLFIRNCQYCNRVCTMEACHQELGYERTDLLWQEIDNPHDLAADKFLLSNKGSNLSTRALDSDFRAKIYRDLVRTFSSFEEVFHKNDGTGL